jgi:hypothetical protein
LAEIRNEIMATGTYQQTYEEISYGAKVRRPLSLWLSSSPTLTERVCGLVAGGMA